MNSGVCPNTGQACEKLQLLESLNVGVNTPESAREGDLRTLVDSHACIGGCALTDLDVEGCVSGDKRALRRKGLIDIYVREASPLLTDEEIDALFSREDRGIEPASMKQFDSLQEFKEGSNNFFYTFVAEEGNLDSYLNRRRKSVQRFSVLFPEKLMELEKIEAIDRRSLGEEDWQRLYEAYQEISQLVDIDDNSVIRAGEVDDYLLCR